MKSMFSWLVSILALMFWVFRVVVTFCESSKIDFIVRPMDLNIEIGLLFFTIICLILIFKRNIIGALAYFAAYAAYFGTDLYNIIMKFIENGNSVLTSDVIIQSIVCIFAIILGLVTALDIAFSKHRKSENIGKHTDWFYKNQKFDRELDERTDKNNYRIY